MHSLLTEICARVILATRCIDKSFRLFDKARSALVLALASDAVLARFNDLVYGTDATYHPNSPAFRCHLSPWEMRVIAAYFPPPPARLLIGGAGGGREVLALACMGYEVLAFEPSGTLATALAKNLKKDLNVRVYRAGYEDMPRLFSVFPQEPGGTLEAEADFDAAILGWTSYSHLRTQAQRIRTLSSFARHVRGPILISFWRFAAADVCPEKVGLLERLKSGFRPVGDRFSAYIGFTHEVSTRELKDAADAAGLSIVHLIADTRDTMETNCPHAILCPIDLVSQYDDVREL